MKIEDEFITADMLDKVLDDKEKSEEEKIINSKKLIVSNDAYLQAKLLDSLITKLEQVRLSNILK